jgi:hypothetical protein
MSDDIRGPIISAIGGFLGVLVGTALIPWIREYHSRRHAARYLAIRTVCILDKYTDECAMVCQDYGEPDQDGRSIARLGTPTTPCFPTDLDWRSINHKLAYELLALPNAADWAKGIVDSCFEHDEDGVFETRSFEYATLGLKTAGLAARLRKTYAIDERYQSESDPILRWDPVSVMSNQLKEIQERRDKRKAAWDEMLPNLPPPPSLVKSAAR